MSTLTGRCFRASFLGFLAVTSFLPISTCLATADVRLELEEYVNYGNIGGGTIVRASCTGALNGWVADYVDRAGEFIEVEFTVDTPVCFVDSLRSAGIVDSVRTIVTSFRLMPAGTEVSADTVVTVPGTGIS
jgi:hypothetical protein